MHKIETRLVVGAILHNAQGHVLLQQRDDKPELRYAGHWTLFGGAVEDGELPEEAINRELVEELELELPLTFWMSYECPARTVAGKVITTNHIYIGEMTRDLNTLTLLEGQAMRYFSRKEAAGLVLAFEQSPVLEQFFNEVLR